MKTILNDRFCTAKWLTLIFLILFLYAQRASAQLFYANAAGSQIKISGSKNNANSAPSTNYFSCEGKFTTLGGTLQSISTLKFDLPLESRNKEHLLVNTALVNASPGANDIKFELTHSMVLPELNVVHAIGFLDIQGARMRVDFQLNFIENNSETITLTGRKSIRLSDYKKEFVSVFADEKAHDAIQIDLKLVVKNHQDKAAFLAAAN